MHGNSSRTNSQNAASASEAAARTRIAKVFPCTKCGECCRHIDAAGGLIPASFDAGGGVCRHLTADGLCAIYDHRPEVCNVDLYYENHLMGVMSREEWYVANKKVCDILKKAAN